MQFHLVRGILRGFGAGIVGTTTMILVHWIYGATPALVTGTRLAPRDHEVTP